MGIMEQIAAVVEDKQALCGNMDSFGVEEIFESNP